MSFVTRKSFLSLAVASALFAGVSVAQAASDCFWARDVNGKHVRDSAGQCVKSGLWHSAVPTPAECSGKAADAPKPAAAPATVTISAVVLFDNDKSTLNADGRAALDALASRLNAGKGFDKMILTGAADSRGADGYNQRLSEARSATVKSYLAGKGIDASRIETRAKGEAAPVASNDTPEGRAKNRRVDIQVQGFRSK